MMGAVLEALLYADRLALEASGAFRWDAITPLFVVASAWWVKTLLFAAVGGVADVARWRRFPTCAAWVLTSVGVVSVVVTLIKDAVDRARPALADPGLTALVATPDNPSFPSGHTATAFAAATVLALLHPALRWPAFALAAVVALSRVYLGVHFWADVLAGLALGVLIGAAVVWVARQVERRVPRRTPRPA